MMKRLIILLLFATPAFAQGFRVGDNAPITTALVAARAVWWAGAGESAMLDNKGISGARDRRPVLLTQRARRPEGAGTNS